MPGAVRIGDVNSAGGAAVGAGATSVLINGRPACLTGTSVTPHPCCGAPGCSIHCAASTTLGSMSVLAAADQSTMLDHQTLVDIHEPLVVLTY